MLFQNPFFFEGRIRRTEYAFSYALYFACVIGILLILQSADFEIVALLLLLPMMWFMLAQGAKRCHDLNHSAFYQLIPFYNLWLLFAKGSTGDNKYGPDPRVVEDLDLEEY